MTTSDRLNEKADRPNERAARFIARLSRTCLAPKRLALFLSVERRTDSIPLVGEKSAA
jgi:hypothetical protein